MRRGSGGGATGRFRWKPPRTGKVLGRPAGSLRGEGSQERHFFARCLEHRFRSE